MIAFDTETDLIARGRLAPRIVCLSYALDSGADIVTDGAEEILREWLRASRLCAHNTSFDMAAVCVSWPRLLPLVFRAYEEGQVECTLLRQRLLDIGLRGHLEDSYSLVRVAGRYDFVVDKDGGWQTGYGPLRSIPLEYWPPGARQYPIRDAEAVRHTYQGQELEGHQLPGGLNSADVARADFALHLASCWGVLTSQPRVEAYIERVRKEQERAQRYLQRAGLVRANGSRDTKKAKTYMERLCERRRKTVKRTEKGGVSLDADACTLIGSRLLELYSSYVSATGTMAKVEDLTFGYELPLQTRYTSLVETSRTSAAKPGAPLKGWQAQNPPNPSKRKRRGEDVRAGFRECLEPDGVYIIADYPSAELYSFAEVCFRQFGHSRLRELLLADKDVHCELAAMSLGKTYEEVLAGRKTVFKRDRDRCKPANYGFLGGMGPDKFILYSRAGYGLLFTREEAVALKRAWQQMLPETRDYFAWIDRMLGGRKTFRFEHPITGFVRAECTFSSGSNFPFQNLTATAAKAALWEVTRRCYSDRKSAMYGYHAPLFLHDEIVLEGKEETAHDASIELAHVMETVYNRYTPNVPLKVEACVSRYWSKDAEPVWRNGRLVPWEGK